MTSTLPLPIPPMPLAAAEEEPTCCPEDEIIPCTACYDKQHSVVVDAQLLLPPVVEEPNFSDFKQAAASLLRVPPPELPHGHAASSPEDITHHQAHARQLPAPNPPDPRTSEKSGPLLAPATSDRTIEGGSDNAAAEEPTCCPEEAELVPCSACYEKLHGGHQPAAASLPLASSTDPAPQFANPAPSVSSPSPATYPLTANAVDYNASVGTQNAYLVGSAMHHLTQQQQQQAHMQPSMYSQMAYTASPPPSVLYSQPQQQPQMAQQVDMFGNMYQQQISAMQMQPQQQYLCQPTPAMYQPFPAPVTMAGPNGGTLVYYPHPAQGNAVDACAQPQLQSMSVVQQQSQQMSHQVPPPGLINYYQQPQQQQQLQMAQSQHSVLAQQPATLAFPQQQPVAYVNNIPVYYTQPNMQQQQQQQPQPPAQLQPQPDHLSHHQPNVYFPNSTSTSTTAPSSTLSSPTPSHSSMDPSIRSYSDLDKTCATYKTEICRSHQYSGACEYGATCQFAHGLDELRTREVDPKYKTERCKNYHAYGPSTCWYGPRCKFIHDEYRVRVGEREFWLISPRENMVRVEKVESSNTARLHQLCQLITEQTGPAQQAAQQLMSQMAAVTQNEQADADGATEQLSKLSVNGEQQMSTSVPAAPKHDAAARFLRVIVSPHSASTVSTPINVQAMQVTNPTPLSSAAKFGMSGCLFNPTTPRTHNPILPRGLPSPTTFTNPIHHHNSHQQSSSAYNNHTSPFPPTALPPIPAPQPHRRPPSHHSSSPYGAYGSSPLSVLSSLLTPRALHSMLAMNAGMLAGGGGGLVADEPQRGRRRRVRKKKNRSGKAAAADKQEESGSSETQDEQAAHSDDDNTDKEDEDSSEAADNSTLQPPPLHLASSSTSA